MTIERIKCGISKAEDAESMDAQIRLADACSSAKPSSSTALAAASNPDGNIAQ